MISVMTPKIIALSTFIFLIFFGLHHADLAQSSHKYSSAFDFLKNLHGYQKGQKAKGINDLKKYLKQFGYLSHKHSSNDDDYFDEDTESAIKKYQQNYNLKITGRLDAETVSKMMMPRCGVPDRFTNKRNVHIQYQLFPGNPKWSSSQSTLTFSFKDGTSDEAVQAILTSLLKWLQVTHFKFNNTVDFTAADLKFSFERRDHGDNAPFDGPGGVLAHATPPTEGIVHFDSEENWSWGAEPGKTDLLTVSLHEIGHALGLAHSSVKEAVMFPYIGFGESRELNEDDIQGIRALYNGTN